MFLPCLNFSTCLLCLPFWSKVHSKPTTAIFTSGSSTSMTFERMGQCDFACDRRIGVVVNHETPYVVSVTSRHRKVRRTYAAHTQRIRLDTPRVKIIRHSIAADTQWVRKVRYRYVVASLHTPHIRDRYSYRIAISYHAIVPRTRYVRAALLSFLRRTCDVCMANRSCYERVAMFLNMFEIIVTPFRTLANEAIAQRISYDSFRCCDVAVAYRAIRDTPYVRKPIRKGVRAV